MKTNNSKDGYLRIGELSKETDISVSALRYYEQIGLFTPAYKAESKYRYYKESDISLAIFIKKAQYLGFSLDEVREILNERKSGKSACPKVRLFAKSKITELQEKVNELKKLENSLKGYITECQSELADEPSDSSVCKLIENVKLKK